MTFLNRAFLYVTRKKGKSALLFFILFIIATFVLTGLSIGKASDAAQDCLRQSLGGRFQVRVLYDSENPYYFTLPVAGNEYSFILGTELAIRQEMIDSIAAVEGIKSYDASRESLLSIKDLRFIAGKIAIEEEFRSLTTVLHVNDTESYEDFVSGEVKLADGRNILPEDSHVAIISKDLAEKNGLAVGDTLIMESTWDGQTYEVPVTIIGLFQQTEEEAVTEFVTSYSKIQNRIYSDIDTAKDIQGFIKSQEHVFDMRQAGADSAEESHAAGMELEKQSESLQDMVSGLKLKRHAGR